MQFLGAAAIGTVAAGALSAIDVVREGAKDDDRADMSRTVSLGIGAVALPIGVLAGIKHSAEFVGTGQMVDYTSRGPFGATSGLIVGLGVGAIAGALIGAAIHDD